MIDVARAAGCSRATLYRYFPNQDALHLGFVARATRRIAAQITTDLDLGSSLADRIVAGIAAVRNDPLLSVWFEPENMAVPIAVSQSSELVAMLPLGLIDGFDPTPEERVEIERRGAWLLRCIVSLLAMPGRDADDERAMIESFVVPVLTHHIEPSRSLT